MVFVCGLLSNCCYWRLSLLRVVISRREGRLHDVAGLADFVVADDTAELVFALLGLTGGGGGVRGIVEC